MQLNLATSLVGRIYREAYPGIRLTKVSKCWNA